MDGREKQTVGRKRQVDGRVRIPSLLRKQSRDQRVDSRTTQEYGRKKFVDEMKREWINDTRTDKEDGG